MKKNKKQVWGGRLSEKPEMLNVLYTAGRDVISVKAADEILIPYDIWVNRAHSIMLNKQGIISKIELSKILKALKQLENDYQSGNFKLDPEKEDVHINTEDYVSDKIGADIGGKIHTGRSRNDQSTTDVRLYIRDECLSFIAGLASLIETLITLAQKHLETVMTGFTHYQPATVTSFAHILTSYAQALTRDIVRFKEAYNVINQNPLGAAASYGTSWNIDREYTAELLAFDSVQENTVDCTTSRWESEAQLASAIVFMMNHLSIISQDLIFLSSPYLNVLKINDAYITGSSMMPQKRNPDFGEVTKAKASLSYGTLMSLMSIPKGLISGYNRDYQWTKFFVMDIIRECKDTPEIFKGVFSTIEINKKNAFKQAMVGFMNAVEIADYIAQKEGIAFRDCYKAVALAVKYSDAEGQLTPEALNKALKESGIKNIIYESDWNRLDNPLENILTKKHTGAPAPEAVKRNIKNIQNNIIDAKKWYKEKSEKIKSAYEICKNFQIEK